MPKSVRGNFLENKMLIFFFALVITLYFNFSTVHAADSNLLLNYHFSEGTGATTADSSGNGNNGILQNSPTWISGKIGNGSSFNGVDQYVDAGNGGSLDITGPISLVAWVKTNSLGNWQEIISKGDYSSGLGNFTYFMVLTPAGKVRFGINLGNAGDFVDSTTALTSGQWHLVVATFDPTTDSVNISVDGTLDSSGTITTDPSSNANSLYVGALKNGGSVLNDFNGGIDEVRIYNRTLFPSEIQNAFNSDVCSSGCEFDTIQAAIDAANSGDIIAVGPGIYREDLTIPTSKSNLNLIGSSTTIKGVSNVLITPPFAPPLAVPNIEILGNGTRLSSFTIEGPDYVAGKYSSGMVIGAPNVKISFNHFVVTPAATADEISQAIQTYHKDAIHGVDISGLNIHDNTFTNLSSGVAGFEGIYINLDEGSGNVLVENNIFTDSVARAITTERSNTIINHNTIVTSLVPGSFGSGGWQGINIGGANSGAISNVLVTMNSINGFSSGKGFTYGIKLGYASSSTFNGVTISKNTIQMNLVGIWAKFTANGVVANFNNIFGNTVGVQNNDTVNTLDARFNWWDSDTGPGHPTLNPTGLGNNVSNLVNFSFWLFQPFNPDDHTRPEVQQLVVSPSSPASAGTLLFTIIFNEDMNPLVTPEVKLQKGTATHIVNPNTTLSFLNGWSDVRAWNGKIVINSSFEDGEYTVRIAKAKDANDNQMLTYVNNKIFIDAISPQFLQTSVTDIFANQNLTLTASVFDPRSSGINRVSVVIDSLPEKNMSFAFRQQQTIAHKRTDIDTYYLIVDGSTLAASTHTVVFKVVDNTGNENISSPITFTKDSSIKTSGGSIAYLCKNAPVSETVRKFDFGTKTSLIQQGYTRVTNGTLYPTDSSYGWSSAVFGSIDRGVGDKLSRDLVYDSAPREFKVNLPSDIYNVTVYMGDMLFAHDDMTVSIEGNVTNNIDTNAGEIKTITNVVPVNDGQLNIVFSDAGGSNPHWVANAVEISSNPICLDGIENQTIKWLNATWKVDFAKYSDWTLADLTAHDLIVCSDQEKACNPTAAVSSAHQSNKIPFIEIPDINNARAAKGFNYLVSSGATSSKSTGNEFIDNPDSINTGFFGSTQILSAPKTLTKILAKLPTFVKDIASPDDSTKGTNMFKVDQNGNQGRFVYVGWFYGRRTSSGFTGWTPFDLNSDGQLLLKRAINWAQCGNPTGCL